MCIHIHRKCIEVYHDAGNRMCGTKFSSLTLPWHKLVMRSQGRPATQVKANMEVHF